MFNLRENERVISIVGSFLRAMLYSRFRGSVAIIAIIALLVAITALRALAQKRLRFRYRGLPALIVRGSHRVIQCFRLAEDLLRKRFGVHASRSHNPNPTNTSTPKTEFNAR